MIQNQSLTKDCPDYQISGDPAESPENRQRDVSNSMLGAPRRAARDPPELLHQRRIIVPAPRESHLDSERARAKRSVDDTLSFECLDCRRDGVDPKPRCDKRARRLYVRNTVAHTRGEPGLPPQSEDLVIEADGLFGSNDHEQLRRKVRYVNDGPAGQRMIAG